MNLLQIKNRFNLVNEESGLELIGYSNCLIDLLKLIERETEFKPEKRFLDAVEILNTISETNAAIRDKLSEVQKQLSKKIELSF